MRTNAKIRAIALRAIAGDVLTASEIRSMAASVLRHARAA